jgi:hypothetical protein
MRYKKFQVEVASRWWGGGGHRVLFHFGRNYGNGDSSVVGVGVSLLLMCDGTRRSTLDRFSNGCMDVWNHQEYKGLNSF